VASVSGVRPGPSAASAGRLTELAAAAAGAVDGPDLVARLALALGDAPERRIPVRIWLLEENGPPTLLAQHPPRSKHPRAEQEAIIAAALSAEPLRVGPAFLVRLGSNGGPLAVLAVGARSGVAPEVLSELAVVVGARLPLLRGAELDGSTSTALCISVLESDIDALLAAFAAEAKRLLDHDRLSVYMLTSDGRCFERFAVATSPVLPGESEVIPIEDLGLNYVLQTNRVLVSADLATDERLLGREDSVIAAGGFHGLLSVPLRVGGKPIGLLNFVSQTAGFYTDEDAVIAQQMADQVAIFFQNLRLEQRVRLAIEREAAQQERNRLAHELHDTLAQSLAAMLVKLDLLAKRVSVADAEGEHEVDAMRSQVQAMLDELRRSLLSLRPAELERQPLTDAMAIELATVEVEYGIKTSLELVGSPGALPPRTETTVFRIFQEAVTNARKHSDASAVAVTLRVGQGLLLSIEDNGAGYVEPSRAEGFGLQSMRERAKEIGGRLIVTSTSGRGTSVHLTLESLGTERPAETNGDGAQRPRGASPSRVTRVLVVDDHPLFRDAVSRLLEREADIRVVGHAGTAQEAVAAVKRLRPDLLLLDVELPDASGIDVLGRIAPADRPPALMVSAFPESGHVAAAMKAGARGYIAKTVPSESLVEAIRAISRGSTIFDGLNGAELWSPRHLAQLTARELDVLKLVAGGSTNAEIGDELCLAKKTVERIVATAVMKLRARNRAHAVAKAVSLKLFALRPD
jgi:signal transduction histidine kinase/DNA-binding NarL/FixJ family response regulator